jgi:hypothetical protein
VEAQNELTLFFKALSDVKRIKIAGALADGPLGIDEIAAQVKLSQTEVSGHIQRLLEAGLLRSIPGQRFVLDRARLEGLARHQFARDTTIHYLVDSGLTEDEKRLISGYMTSDGQLEQIPLQSKKLKVVLKYALALIEPGQVYTEKELNAELARIHPDSATLRRALVDQGDLLRKPDGSLYWRVVPEVMGPMS